MKDRDGLSLSRLPTSDLHALSACLWQLTHGVTHVISTPLERQLWRWTLKTARKWRYCYSDDSCAWRYLGTSFDREPDGEWGMLCETHSAGEEAGLNA